MIAGAGFARGFRDNSYLWHVRAGDLQLTQGSVLTSDPFSFTMAGADWRTQSWLAELLYSPLDAAFGLGISNVYTAVCAVLTFVLIGLIAYSRSRSIPSVAVLLVATTVLFTAFLNPRPVIFSFPLFAAVVAADDDRRLRWTIPLLMWVWASVHGSFFIGLAYLGLRAIVSGLTRRRVVELGIAGVATLFTAHGLAVVKILTDFLTNRAAVQIMAEWLPPDLISLPFFPLLLGFFGLALVAQQGRLRGRDWIIVVPFAALAVSSARSAPPAWIALVPILARLHLPIGAGRMKGSLPIALSLIFLASPLLLQEVKNENPSPFPVEAARHLTSARVFHDDATGGWLIYTQWPQRQVYVDDRAELYGQQLLDFADAISAKPGWREELERSGIEEALLEVESPLAAVLAAEGWRESYRDDQFVIFIPGERGEV